MFRLGTPLALRWMRGGRTAAFMCWTPATVRAAVLFAFEVRVLCWFLCVCVLRCAGMYLCVCVCLCVCIFVCVLMYV